MINKKINFIFASLSFLFLLIIIKAAYIQIFNKQKLMRYSDSQLIRKVIIHPKRGTIYDRNMNPLAINIETYNIFVIPKKNEKYKQSFLALDKILNKNDYKKNYRKLKERNKFTWLYRNIVISEEQKEEFKKIKNIDIESSPKRIYPNNELLSQALGFVGIDNRGLAGAELSFNKDLEGEEQIIKYFRDAKGRPVKIKSIEDGKKSKDLVLSIDKEIQAVSEKFLKDAIIKHKALKGGVVVMSPENGEVLAMANYPTFDLNNSRSANPYNQKLSVITDPIEPGSIFKTVTILSGMEHNIIRKDTSYYCEQGKLKVDNHYITEAESKKKYEWLSVEEILRYSSNIGTTKIAFDITYPKLKETIAKFHFGKKTNIELQGESKGMYRSDSDTIKKLEFSNLSFGQGIGTTALQIMTFYSAIANGGYLIEPTIIKDKIRKKEKVIDENVISQLNEILIKAVNDGTGDQAKIKYVDIAGKTSTAQKIINGKYSSYISGFIGYPVNVKEKFLIYVYIEDPSVNGYYGNIVAGPVFKNIAEYILFKNKEYEHLKNENLAMDTHDGIKHIQSSPIRKVEEGSMANFIGLDKASANKLASRLQLEVDSNGFGVVYEQTPAAGTKISKGSQVKLNFQPPMYE